MWYQGEANAHISPGATPGSAVPPPLEYACAFTAMVRGWQAALSSNLLGTRTGAGAGAGTGAGQPALPVVFAQIHAYCNGVLYCGLTNASRVATREIALPLVREAQLRASIALRNTTVMTIGADLGDTAFPLGPAGQIHPRCKGPVGDRLAAAALQLVYGRGAHARSPTPLRAAPAPVGGPPNTVRVTVRDTGPPPGLVARPRSSLKCPTARGSLNGTAVGYQAVFCQDDIGFEVCCGRACKAHGVAAPAARVFACSECGCGFALLLAFTRGPTA